MTDELKTLLNQRAHDDVRALQALRGAANDFCEGKEMCLPAAGRSVGQKVESHVSPRSIHYACCVAIAAAGEAVKQIERTQPEIIAAYPDYPWLAFKRLRDLYSHPTRSRLNGETLDDKKYAQVIKDYYKNAKPEDLFQCNDNPLLEEVAGAWKLVDVLGRISYEQRNEPTVNITSHPSLEYVKQRSPGMAEVLPGIVAHYHMRFCMISMGDAIDYTSAFFRGAEDMPVDYKPLLAVRNRAAHFVDPSDQRRKPGDPNIWDEMLAIEPLVKEVADKLTPIPQVKDTTTTERLSNDIAAHYYVNISEMMHHDPEKLKLLDEVARFGAEPPKKNRTVQDALVMASVRLLETTPMPQAREVLDYVMQRKGEIKHPQAMIEKVTDVSHSTEVTLRRFLEDVARFMEPPGKGLGH